MDRRTFLKVGSIGAAAVAGGFSGDAAVAAAGPVYRTLGRTGLKVSIVGLGAMRTTEPAVMQAAFDQGVNYVDTARCYQGGNNERIVGRALRGYRDKVFVASKVHRVRPVEDILRSVEESLVSLQTDHIDVIQLHHPSKTHLLREEPKEALAKLRQAGKIRFTGVTTHSDEVGVLNAVVDDPDKFYDMVLVVYNTDSSQALKDAVARAAKAKVGIVAMKTQKGGYKPEELGGISPHQAMLKYVLNDRNVAAAVPAMTDLAQVKEDTAVMHMDLDLTRRDQEILHRYAEAVKPYYCRRCGACEPTCPLGVDIPTVNRALMYAEGYGDPVLARATHAELPQDSSSFACGNCSECLAHCPNGINIGERMATARTLMA
jgi:predicted aldo/keto reductase-like oxidoreductase